jgi:hypothetical protein
MLDCMGKVVKKIRGHEYAYNVKWDCEKKKQVWIYEGKIGGKKKKIDFDREKIKEELYHAIKRDVILKISNKNLKRLRNIIKKTLDNM